MQCGPSGQLTNDFTKMQGMGPMGMGPAEGGMDGDMGMMGEMPMMMGGGGGAGTAEMIPPHMLAEFNQMMVNPSVGGSSASAAAPMAMAHASAAVASAGPMHMPMAGGGMMMNPMMGMNPMMMGMNPMMMGGGPQLMYPHQMQMMQQQQQQQQVTKAAPQQQQQQAPLPAVPQQQAAVTLEAMLAQPLDESNWLQQFRTEQTAATAEAQDGVKTLGHEGEDLRSMEDKTTDSEFYGFMQKVNDGKIIIDEDASAVTEVDKPAGAVGDDWMAQLKAAQAHVDAEHGAQMAGHIPDPTTEAWRMNNAATATADGLDGNMLDGLQQQWGEGEEEVDADFTGEEFYDAQLDGEAWAAEYKELLGKFADAQNATDYPFEPENPFIFHDDPLTEGKQLLAMGILSDAVLAFEAACQKQTENQEAWKLLGTTQAENEKDMLAIRALNKAKQIDPRDKEVYMALSVSHANESNHAFALESLRGWLLCQPEYEMLVDVVATQSAAEAQTDAEGGEDYAEFVGMLASPREMKDVVTLFGAAIEMNPADAALHVGLGIAYHLSHDFENAVGCFRAALAVTPDDAKVWNKLGATLANSSKSEEAIQMYESALNINPGYVRARYNLGIAHNNLGHHEIAAQHFARAIVMQQGGAADDSAAAGGPGRSTREMWDALRMALNFTNRQDLVQHTWKQDIAPILAEFGLSDLAF